MRLSRSASLFESRCCLWIAGDKLFGREPVGVRPCRKIAAAAVEKVFKSVAVHGRFPQLAASGIAESSARSVRFARTSRASTLEIVVSRTDAVSALLSPS